MKRLFVLFLLCLTLFAQAEEPLFDENSYTNCNTSTWKRYKSIFGAEKIIIGFPEKPIVSYTDRIVTARAHKGDLSYIFSGYFPPAEQMDETLWFEQLRFLASIHPNKLVEHTMVTSHIMDYTYYDFVREQTISARAIATPFNGYILQCVKSGTKKGKIAPFVEKCHIQPL